MFALRSFARSLPRAAARVSKPIAPRATSLFVPRQQPVLRAFSTSIWRREPAGDSDQVLSAKLENEYQLELESQDQGDLKAGFDVYFANSPFKLEDKAGTHNVVLTRTFGNENIRVEFSVQDMNDVEEELDMDEDPAFDDELPADTTSGGKRTINQSGVKGGKIDVAPEDSIAPSDTEGDYAQGFESQYPLSLGITITKPGKGATVIQATAQNGAIDILQLSYYPKAELVEPKTPEQVHESEAIYTGPPFTNLDPDLQTMVVTYLEERGINAELAETLPQYVEYKEQREYVQLLKNLKDFVDE